MSHDGKWITGLTAPVELVEAARRVFQARLGIVRQQVTQMLHGEPSDIEAVHQLRVATRRAGASLELFADCVPPRRYKTARKLLRRLRRAAGAVRDWDVFTEMLGGWMQTQRPEAEQAGLDFLLGYSQGQRQAGLTALAKVLAKQAPRVPAVVADLIHSVQPPRDGAAQTLCESAQQHLRGLLTELDEAIHARPSDFEHLHQIRIIAKRLRYAIEIFADLYAPELREQLYPAIVQAQELLGSVNDSHVAVQRLATVQAEVAARLPSRSARLQPGLAALRAYHEARLGQAGAEFARWCDQWQSLIAQYPPTELLAVGLSLGSD